MLPIPTDNPWAGVRDSCAPVRCRAKIAFCAALICLSAGCNHEGTIKIEYEPESVRFIIDHEGWPRPFWTPRVTEFAIASEEDGPIWQLQSIDNRGLAAKRLTIDYGRLPPGFLQVFPEGAVRPTMLTTHRTYFVAAGGPRAVYRIVFAMPVTERIPVPDAPQRMPGRPWTPHQPRD